MKSFILVHGSWHNAWNWHKVIPILEAKGHEIFAVDLPGMGRDKTPIQDVTLQTSVDCICALIDQAKYPVILVGHSKNGIIISQAAEFRYNKIEKLNYLAAFLIADGNTQAAYSALDTEGILKPYVNRYPETKSHTLQPEIYKEGLYHDCENDIYEMAKILLSHESAVTGITPLQLSTEKFGSVPRYYIECTEDRAVTSFIQKKMYTEMPCVKVFSMATSHSPFFSAPNNLCKIFEEIASD